MNARDLPRKLGLLDGISLVVGIMIGSAIFLVPNTVAQNLPSRGLILMVWTFAGLLSLIGALGYAELAAMMPATGGQYVFLREAYGPLAAFLCGWMFFLVARSGATAAVAVGFSIYLSYFIPLTPVLSKLSAVALILASSLINYRGVQAGARVQKLFTLLKVVGLAAIIASAFFYSPGVPVRSPGVSSDFSLHRFAVALIACLWTYNGWAQVTFVAGEIKEPGKNLPRSISFGVLMVILIYLLANLAYLRVLSIPEIAVTERVSATMAERTMGPLGAALVSLTIILSTIGTTNGNILTAPRLYFAQARDGLFFRSFGEIQPRFQTPGFSILAQGLWSAVLAASGSYSRLYSYSLFAYWLFYGMTVAGVVILGRRWPQVPRPYRMWGSPATAVLFVGLAAWFMINIVIASPGSSVIGLLLMALGVPVYYFWRRKLARGMKTAPA